MIFFFLNFEITIKTLVSISLSRGFLFGIENLGSFKNPSFGLCFNLRCFRVRFRRFYVGCGFLVDVEFRVRLSGIWNSVRFSFCFGFIFCLRFGVFFLCLGFLFLVLK